MSARHGFAIVAMGVLAGACSFVTGSNGYEEVSRCTGPMCGVCSSGTNWDPAQEVCIEESVWCEMQGRDWDTEQQACLPKGTCPAGKRWEPGGAICVAECSKNTTPCGLTCCAQTQYCITEAAGNQRCDKCEKAEYICGPDVCCEPGATCTDATIGVCMATYGVAKQSCAGGLDCLGGVSCCETLAVPGGTFPQGSPASDSEAFSDEQPERTVTVSSYALDKYEVTVGRFRKFVKEWDPKAPPPGGAGAHPRIAGSGWRSAWNKRLPKDLADFERLLACDSSSTWTSSTGLNESLPINCVSWYEAFAFCAWDGGRLPTEAEWEYAAAGGEKNWKYPWGADAPTKELAVYNCGFKGPGGPADCFTDDIAPVGSKPNGAGRWGQLDLAGSMSEWVLDAYDEYPEIGSKDFAKTEDIPIRIMRGGSWGSLVRNLRAAYRYYYSSSYRLYIIGFRCAREQ